MKKILPKDLFELVIASIKEEPVDELCKRRGMTPQSLQMMKSQFMRDGWKVFTKSPNPNIAQQVEEEEEDGQKKIFIRRVKKVYKGGHHGGSWKVAYADFVTAMMAFFLLMWLVTMSTEEKKMGVAEYFEKYSILAQFGISDGKGYENQTKIGFKGVGRDGGDPWEQMTGKLKIQMEGHFNTLKDRVEISLINEGFMVQLIDREDAPMFRMGSAELSDWARIILKIVSENVIDIPNKIAVEGHTDSVPFSGNGLSNWDLSSMRAAVARAELEKGGIPPARFSRVTGFADKRPFITDDSTDPRNRRIVVVILK